MTVAVVLALLAVALIVGPLLLLSWLPERPCGPEEPRACEQPNPDSNDPTHGTPSEPP